MTVGTLNKRYGLPGPSSHHGLLDTHFKAKTITYLAIDVIKDTDDRSSSRWLDAEHVLYVVEIIGRLSSFS